MTTIIDFSGHGRGRGISAITGMTATQARAFIDEAVAVTAQAQSAATSSQTSADAAQQAEANAAEAVTLAQQAQAAAYNVPDVAMRDIINNPVTQTRAALASYERARASLQPPTLQRVTSVPTGTGPRFIEKVGDLLYGVVGATGAIHTSPDGVTWTQVNATWNGASGFISRLVPTADGEMVALTATEVRKSNGWSTDPATATWSPNMVVPNGSCNFNGFGLSGGNSSDPYAQECDKLILVEYNSAQETWSESRYAHVSVDAGSTWSTVYDSELLHGAADAAVSHLHAACYDPWGDVFYVGEGHGPSGGLYFSTDDGATWGGPLRVDSTATTANNAPTVMAATDDGMVMGSDNSENGVFGMVRKTNPADQRIVWNWRMQTGRAGLITFAQRSWRDPDTGLVYITFRAEYADTPLTIAAGTAGAAGRVYEYPTLPVNGGADRFSAVAKIGADTLFVYAEVLGVPYHFRGTLTKQGALPLSIMDGGNALNGKATDPTSLAVGRASTTDAAQATAIGQGAKVTNNGTGATAIGYGASASTSEATAIGRNAVASNAGTAVGSSADGGVSGTAVGFGAQVVGSSAVVIGGGSARAGTETVAVGHGASATAAYSVAVGKSAVTSESAVAVGRMADARLQSVAVGREAVTSGNNSVALGYQAKAGLDGIAIGHMADSSAVTNSVALGRGTVCTGSNQVKIGAGRYFELDELAADAPTAAPNTARFFSRDNGAGKTQLCVRFNTGAVQILATEP